MQKMILDERDTREQDVINIARHMMVAARTAPKGKGVDIIEIKTVAGDDIEKLALETEKQAEETGMKFFFRDANCVRSAGAVVLIGTKEQKHGLNCYQCGYSCQTKPEATPCAINTIDVGIAIGSAVATASDMRADTRIMFSVGFAAQKAGWMGECRQVIAIPVSISSKNPFFDRKPKEQEKPQ